MSSTSAPAGGPTAQDSTQRGQQRPAPPSEKEIIAAREREIGGHLDDHGHSRPAWTGVGLVILGALVASVAMLVPLVWLVITGLAVMAAGGPVGWLMARASNQRPAAQGEKKTVS